MFFKISSYINFELYLAHHLKIALAQKINFMKKFLLLLLASISICTPLFSQNSNLVFFAENGEKFTIVMNGLKYNEAPATNVKLTDLAPGNYKVKAIFDDPTLGIVTSTIQLEPFLERTFNIRPKKQTGVGKTLNKMGNQVARDANLRDSSDVKTDDKEKYVMRLLSEVPYGQPQMQRVQQQPVYNTQPIIVQQPGSVTQTTTTTTRGNGVSPGGANVSVGVNDPSVGVNFNMNVGVPGTVVTNGSVQQTTTTTTYGTPQTQVVQQQQTYVMPGYNGPVGCPWPMDNATFNNAVTTINNQSFEDNKLQVAKQVFTTNCMTSSQVAELLKSFDFEQSRLDFAKFAYGHTFDIGNYFMVNNAFDFPSSVDELNAYIRGGR